MNFLEYMDAKYTEATMDLRKDFNLFVQATSEAAQGWIALKKKAYRLVAYPMLLWDFFLVKVEIKPAPKSQQEWIKEMMAEKMKEIKDKAHAANVSEESSAVQAGADSKASEGN
jgi:hypothetical protein